MASTWCIQTRGWEFGSPALVPSLKEWISQLQNTWLVVRRALDNITYKIQAGKKRTQPKDIKVENLVYLSTQFLQSLQPSKKIGPKFVGPFPIKCIINPATVELEWPKSLRRVQPIFHCSLIKLKSTSPLCPTPPAPEPFMIEGEQHFEIKQILDSQAHRVKDSISGAMEGFPRFWEWVAG